MRNIIAAVLLCTATACIPQGYHSEGVIWEPSKPFALFPIAPDPVQPIQRQPMPPMPPAVAADMARAQACQQAQIDAGYIYGRGLDQGWHYSCVLGRLTPFSGF